MTKSLAASLEHVLADIYALYLKTQNYHWNVEGCNFRDLHSMFEEQYNDLFKAVDTAAELIRGLGHKVPATFEIFGKNTKIKNGDEKAAAGDMLKDLLNDQYVMENTLQAALSESQKVNDEVVSSFLVERLTVHRKNAWMLKSCSCIH